MELVLPRIPRSKTYRVESASRLQAAGRTLEYHETVQAEVALLGREGGTALFRLRTEPPQATGNNQAFTWANDANAFLRELVLRVDPHGQIEEVLNTAELLATWPAHRQVLQRTYGQLPYAAEMLRVLDEAVREEGFLQRQITANGVSDFLFPGLYHQYPSNELASRKAIRGYFGAIDLPLRLQSAVQPAEVPGEGPVLRTTGELDAAALDEDGFRRFLKDATDTYDIRTALTAEFEATYQLDAQQWPVAGELFLHVQAGGTAYRNTLARKFTAL